MGLLATIKHLAPLSLYALGLGLAFLGFFGKGRWALLLVTFLIPLRNVVDKIQDFPGGNQFVDLLILGAFLTWLTSSLQEKKHFFSPSTLNKAIIILVLYTFFTLLLGNNYLYGSFSINLADDRIKDWKNYCLMPLLFFITLNIITDRTWIKRILLVMLAAIFIMDYYTVSQISIYTSLISREKINGTFVFLGPNEVAAFYNEFTIIMVAIFFYIKNKRLKLILLLMIIIGTYCIIFLYSRGAYLGFFTGLAFLFFLKKRRYFIPLILVAIFWQAVLPQKAIERIKGTTNEFGQLDESSERRLLIWQQALNLYQENPISGIGYGVFRYLGLDLGDTHNIYIKILVEQGTVGMILFLIVIFCFLRMGYILYKKGDDDLAKGMGLGLMTCMMVVFINNCFGDRWAYFELSSYLWIFGGLVARYIILSEEKTIEITPTPTLIKPTIVPEVKKKKKVRYYDL